MTVTQFRAIEKDGLPGLVDQFPFLSLLHRRRDLFALNWRRRCTLLRLATGQQAA
jgi:hypothetical protein